MQTHSSPVLARTFFVLTFCLSWIIWIPLVMAHFKIGPLHVPDGLSSAVRLLGVLMPAVAALVLTGRTQKGALRHLLGRLGIWQVNGQWWVAAVALQPLLLIAVGLGYNAAGGYPPVQMAPFTGWAALLVNIIFLALATLGEEIGWRGVALPSLQQGNSALRSSLILGVIWAAWHIPFWLLLDTFDQFGFIYIVMNFLMVIPFTMYITWFFNHSQGSLLLPAAFHLVFNITNNALLPVTTNLAAFSIFVLCQWIMAAVLYRRLEPAAAPILAG